MMNVRVHTLSNGCKVLIRPTPDKRILSMVATVQWGGRDDPAEAAGRSNLMARLLTKGAGSRNALQIAETMESVGGSIDPFCGADWLGIETQTVQEDWRVALELLADCLFQPTFEADEFEKERALVQSEILRDEDKKFPYTYKAFQRLFYRGHPYATNPEGEVETVADLKRETLPELHAGVMRPERMLLVAVGNAPEREFLAELEKRWPKAGAPPTRERPIPKVEAGAGRGETVVLRREFEQGFVIAGFSAPLPGAEDAPALRVACGVLGEGMSSRLFSRLRDRDHLAYAVGATFSARALGSHLMLYIGTSPETVDRALEGLLREARDIAAEPPGKEEIERARQYILGKYLVGLQTNSALAQAMSAYELLGLGWEWGEKFPDRIKAVVADDLLAAAARYFVNPAVAVLRPEPPEK